MKRAIIIFLLILTTAGCASLKTAIFRKRADIAILPPYSGPKTKIVVADFEVKANKATDEIGRDLRETLIMALKNSNRFLIVEPQELSAAIPSITVVVSEFEPRISGGSAGIGGGGGVNRGILGGLLTTASSKPHMALDIRIIDTSTSKALASTRVLGQASEVEKAIRICIIEAVRYISQTVPENYYKY